MSCKLILFGIKIEVFFFFENKSQYVNLSIIFMFSDPKYIQT